MLLCRQNSASWFVDQQRGEDVLLAGRLGGWRMLCPTEDLWRYVTREPAVEETANRLCVVNDTRRGGFLAFWFRFDWILAIEFEWQFRIFFIGFMEHFSVWGEFVKTLLGFEGVVRTLWGDGNRVFYKYNIPKYDYRRVEPKLWSRGRGGRAVCWLVCWWERNRVSYFLLLFQSYPWFMTWENLRDVFFSCLGFVWGWGKLRKKNGER